VPRLRETGCTSRDDLGFSCCSVTGKEDDMAKPTSILALGILLLALPALCRAQETEEPVKAYTGNIGAGFSLTGGNTDTVNFNVSGELTYDPKTKNVMKFNGLYLRANANDVDTADRLSLRFRDEYSLSERILIYGEMGYLRDPFKDITYLLNPQGGIGFKAILTEKTKLTLSAGTGSVWEKNPDTDVQNSGTVNAGESFSLKLSETSGISQEFSALWKTSDFNDALYHFNISLITSITSRSEVKVEFIDDFKNVTPNPSIEKNDTAFIVSFLYKI
jgi:putative salt-induced outer membrane protein YdiY